MDTSLSSQSESSPSQASTADEPDSGGGFRYLLNRNVLLLWLGQIVSKIGDWCLWVAIPVTVYNETNSKVALAFTVFTEALPFLIFSPIAGIVVDRFDRKRIMIAADLGRAGLVALLLIPLAAGPRSHVPLPMYYVILFGCSALSAFFGPARMAVMTQLIPRRSLVRVNAALATGMEISELIGPAIGGMVLALLLQRGSFLLDAVSFVFSALCIGGLSARHLPARRKRAMTAASAVEDMRTGLRVLLTTPLTRGMVLWWNFGYLATALFESVLYALARDAIHADDKEYGILLSCMGGGVLMAGILVATILHRARPSTLIVGGLLGAALSAAAMATAHTLAQADVAMFVFGASGLFVNVTANTLVQSTVPQELLGRYFGAFSFVARIAQLVGTACAGPLSSVTSLPTTYFISTALYLISGFLAYYLVRSYVEFGARTEPSPNE